MNRTLLAMAVVAAATLLGASPSRAEYSAYGEGRYCAVVSNGNGSAKEICNFNDFESCRMEVVSGNRGFCNNNPRWVAAHGLPWGGEPGSGPPGAHRSKHHHRRH